MARSTLWPVLAAAAGGATVALLLDPHSGHRRRALLRDKAGHYRRDMPRRTRGAVRGVRGPLRGIAHTVLHRLPGYTAPLPPEDDTFVKQRVESVLGHAPDLPLTDVTIEAVDGIVRLRGTVPDSDAAGRLVARVAAVEGVRAVDSQLQSPDGVPLRAIAGDRSAVTGPPRAALLGVAVRECLLVRWPELSDADILASEGHVDRLVAVLHERTGAPVPELRTALDEILLTVV